MSSMCMLTGQDEVDQQGHMSHVHICYYMFVISSCLWQLFLHFTVVTSVSFSISACGLKSIFVRRLCTLNQFSILPSMWEYARNDTCTRRRLTTSRLTQKSWICHFPVLFTWFQNYFTQQFISALFNLNSSLLFILWFVSKFKRIALKMSAINKCTISL